MNQDWQTVWWRCNDKSKIKYAWRSCDFVFEAQTFVANETWNVSTFWFSNERQQHIIKSYIHWQVTNLKATTTIVNLIIAKMNPIFLKIKIIINSYFNVTAPEIHNFDFLNLLQYSGQYTAKSKFALRFKLHKLKWLNWSTINCWF